MKLTINQISKDVPEEIILCCHDPADSWVKSVQSISGGQLTIQGISNEKVFRIKLRDIYYFEVVDGASFVYCQNDVFSCKQRLYEFEALCSGTMLFRCSKSMILNAEKISYVRPSFSGRFETVLDNGEKVIVSRQYVPELKRLFGA